MADPQQYTLSQAAAELLAQMERWVRNFTVQGAPFTNRAEGASLTIPAQPARPQIIPAQVALVRITGPIPAVGCYSGVILSGRLLNWAGSLSAADLVMPLPGLSEPDPTSTDVTEKCVVVNLPEALRVGHLGVDNVGVRGEVQSHQLYTGNYSAGVGGSVDDAVYAVGMLLGGTDPDSSDGVRVVAINGGIGHPSSLFSFGDEDGGTGADGSGTWSRGDGDGAGRATGFVLVVNTRQFLDTSTSPPHLYVGTRAVKFDATGNAYRLEAESLADLGPVVTSDDDGG